MVTLRQIEEAHSRIRSYVRRTPTVRLAPLRQDLPYRVWLKCENLQATGSFKSRGAVNRLFALSPEEVQHGIITASGGNHGLGVAYAARLLGVAPTVYVPEKASKARRDHLQRWGAQVIAEGRDWDDAYAAAFRKGQETGATLVHPFDDPWVIAGQGTAAAELVEDCPEPLDAVLAGIGGGGLISGTAVLLKAKSPGTAVIGVEPAGAASMTASMAAGHLVELSAVSSIADTLSARKVGPLTLEIAIKLVDRVVLVEDAALLRAMTFLWDECNLLVEPSGAAPLAALREGETGIRHGSTVGLIVSGGNIDAGPSIDLYR